MRDSQAEARVNRANRRVGEFLQGLTEGQGAKGIPGGVVVGLSVRLPTETQPEVLLVIRAAGDDGRFVAFVGGLDVNQAVLVWAAKGRAGGMRWRVDVPWQDR